MDPSSEELATIAAGTGDRWTVLGRLAGGYSDRVHLLGRGAVRAVLKVKEGAWWVEQLDRLRPVIAELRLLGYPTPNLIGAGQLSTERAYLLTEWSPGTAVSVPTAGQLTEILATAERHRDVHPPPERDWSAMVTLFLNGGIEEFAFDPTLTPYVDQALALVPRPVPALPTGAFVHGDFATQNVLFQNGQLCSVIDIEGFGAGTPVIDLVNLASSMDDSDRCRTVVRHALQLADTDVVRACLAHRVLGWLAWASEHREFTKEASSRVRRLLAVARELGILR